MKLAFALASICLLLTISSCRTEAKKVEPTAESMPAALTKINNAFVEGMNFKVIECPWYLTSHKFDDGAVIEERCLVSEGQPEDILAGLSEQLEQLGKVQMQWRFDVGSWVTSYKFFGDNFELLVSLRSPYESEYMQKDPIFRNYGTVAKFYIEQKELKPQKGA